MSVIKIVNKTPSAIKVISPSPTKIISVITKGPQGPQGVKGDPGVIDNTTIQEIKDQIPGISGFDGAAFFNAMIA